MNRTTNYEYLHLLQAANEAQANRERQAAKHASGSPSSIRTMSALDRLIQSTRPKSNLTLIKTY
jgi:hypothetical protein